MAVWQAKREGVKNFSMLVSHVLVPPAIAGILQAPENRVQGFLGPGHVCAIRGFAEYEAISLHFHVPIVITGFEPLDILEGTLMVVRQLESAALRWKISTFVQFAGKGIGSRKSCCSKYSRFATANGAVSARFQKAAIGCVTSFAITTPSDCLK